LVKRQAADFVSMARLEKIQPLEAWNVMVCRGLMNQTLFREI
jgi:hypothetical protein